MSPLRSEHGFTLIEMLVALALSTVLFGATVGILEAFQRQNSLDQLRNETQDHARNAIDRLSRQLRNVAAPSAAAAGALEVAEPYSLTFQTIDSSTVTPENPTNKMRVRYCLDDSTTTNEILWLQQKRWGKDEAPLPTNTTCPDKTGNDWESSTQLVQHVTNRIGGQNRPVFEYSPASPPALVSQITNVESTLFINLRPGSVRPGESQLTTSIALRNENRAPVAAFTAVQLGSTRRIVLNASESLDPDGLAITYTWWDGSTELPTSSQQYETEPLVLGSRHTFKLRVVDPGGLTSTTEQTVTIK